MPAAAATGKAPTPRETAFSPAASDIARRAYLSYVDRGMAPGQDLEHWLQAEARLIAEHRGSLDQDARMPI